MINEWLLLGEELEREIIIVQQAFMMKCTQLDETKRTLREKIIEHQRLKNRLDENVKESEDVRFQLNISSKANEKLQEENAKLRELTAKLQTQMDSYLTERRILTDRCHNSDIEVCKLKNQIMDLQDQLTERMACEKRYNQYQANTKNIIDQISSKQEILIKEQSRLEKAIKEGLSLATKISEEIDIEKVFVKEANITRIKLENETLRLLGILEAERNERKKLLSGSRSQQDGESNYLADWKSSQEEMMATVRCLTEENKCLLDEVEGLKTRIDYLMANKNEV